MTRKEEIENAASEYAEEHPMHHSTKSSFVAGAEWMYEEFEKNRLEHCDSITKEQYDLESNFVSNHLEKHHRVPTILDAIEYGLEKGKEEMLEKAIEWLEENAGSYLLYPFCEYDKGSLIEDFRKAMEK
jgi:hypothetical protein